MRRYGTGLEKSGFRVEVGDLHDQVIVRITGTDDPGICLHLFRRQDDDADATLAMLERPFEVGFPLQADALRFPFQRRSESGAVRRPSVFADDFVLPHRHHDGRAVVAYRRSAKMPAGAGRAEMLKTGREGPSPFHIAAAKTTFQRWAAANRTVRLCSQHLYCIQFLKKCMLIINIVCIKSVQDGFHRANGST